MFKANLKHLGILVITLGLFSCETPEQAESTTPMIRAGEALKIANTPLNSTALSRAETICQALEVHHDNILRSLFQEDFIFSRRRKVYGDQSTRELTNKRVYIDVPNDYESTPVYKASSGTLQYFIEEIPTENNLYLANICDYVLNNVGSAPKVQEKVSSRYHVFNFIGNDRLNIGIYTRNSDGNYYLYRSSEYRFNVQSSSRYYGIVTEQSEVFIKDYRGSDYSVLYQKLERVD